MWVKVDDRFDEHPKFEKIQPLSTVLWLKCLAYCNRNLTDGHIPRDVARQRAWLLTPDDPDSLPNDLVSAGLWDQTPTGFYVHDFETYQPSKAEVLAERKAAEQRKERWKNGRENAVPNAVPSDRPGSRFPLPVSVPETVTRARKRKIAPSPADSPPADSVFAILTNREGVLHHVLQRDVLAFQGLYPAVDVMQELRNMVAWTMANREKRKTLRGSPAFVNRWLAKEQDKFHSNGGQKGVVFQKGKGAVLMELAQRMREAEANGKG